MLRICRQCAAQYDGAPGSTLCPKCAADSRTQVVQDRTCRECGTTFPGGPRAWYCPSCRIERQRRHSLEYHQRVKAGATRKLGSTDLCIVCQEPYTVTSGNQRYCPACAAEAVREIDREQSRQWQADNTTPEDRRATRQAQAGERPCRICGKLFVPHDASQTCSPECSAELRHRNAADCERANREQRNSYRREQNARKLAAMTPEELAVYREKVNAKARENYRKRKEKHHDQS